MSMTTQVSLAPESAEPPSTSVSFVVGQDRLGHWIVRESHGLSGGIFISREAALDYAEFESDFRPGAIRLATRPLELGL